MSEAQDKFFLGRQPILDREQNIFGYELLFRSADISFADITDFSQAGASVILHTLSGFGFSEVLGKHKGFFNVTGELLLSDAVELLPREQIVIELLESIEITDEIVERCLELKNKGFSLALDDNFYDLVYEPLYSIVDVVKIDILEVTQPALSEMVRILKDRPVTLLAEKVETTEQFNECLDLGFRLFQGYYFAHPSVLKKKRVDVSGTALLKLLQLVLQDAEIKEIEETFRQNPGLSYNLLRLVNSVALGMRETIKTLRHALMVLGLQQLRRWVQLALYSYGTGKGSAPLLETAAIRGRLMELIVQKQCLQPADKDYADRAFMTGMLSLVDVLFETPMEQIIQQLNLAKDVRLALRSREGDMGRLLLLVESLEAMDFQAAANLLGESSCNVDTLFEAQLEAINWANRLHEVV
jgi:EAL and modified HD-GYP domain-containing signal transduction protein